MQLDIGRWKAYPTLADLSDLQSENLRFQPFVPNSLHLLIIDWYFKEKVEANHSLGLIYTETVIEEKGLTLYVRAKFKIRVSNEKFPKIEKNIFKHAIYHQMEQLQWLSRYHLEF